MARCVRRMLRLHPRPALSVAVCAALACLALGVCLANRLAKSGRPDLGPMRMDIQKSNNGVLRTFAGRAAPPTVIRDPRSGREVRLYEYFPNWRDPFAINAYRELGEGGYRLRTEDRGLAGALPMFADVPWALNMIPFGVTVDGTLIDPSGPWYDGGPADPRNPFDRNCTGWEYEVLHPTVRHLVGLPDVASGHVQPGGLFHYHGYPDLLIASLRERKRAASEAPGPLAAGYSADGFPIIDYVIEGNAPTRPSVFFFSGYVLREGDRTAQQRTNPAYVPPGKHDGLYVQDYVFDPQQKQRQIEAALASRGAYHGLKADDMSAGRAVYLLLDAHNGHVLRGAGQALAGYPKVHYAYVFTPDWPQTPRIFAFEPDDSFKRIIPFQFERDAAGRLLARLRGEPQGRKTLYDNCSTQQREVHIWEKRSPY